MEFFEALPNDFFLSPLMEANDLFFPRVYRRDMLFHFPDHITDALSVRINDDVTGTGRKMQSVIIRFARIAATVVTLFQCFFRAGQREANGLDPSKLPK